MLKHNAEAHLSLSPVISYWRVRTALYTKHCKYSNAGAHFWYSGTSHSLSLCRQSKDIEVRRPLCIKEDAGPSSIQLSISLGRTEHDHMGYVSMFAAVNEWKHMLLWGLSLLGEERERERESERTLLSDKNEIVEKIGSIKSWTCERPASLLEHVVLAMPNLHNQVTILSSEQQLKSYYLHSRSPSQDQHPEGGISTSRMLIIWTR